MGRNLALAFPLRSGDFAGMEVASETLERLRPESSRPCGSSVNTICFCEVSFSEQLLKATLLFAV